MTAFRVGQRVAAIPRPAELEGAVNANVPSPVVGKVYTIRGIQTVMRSNGKVMTGLLFEEIKVPKVHTSRGLLEPDYHPGCFRPIVSRPTSIAVFQAMLTGKRVGVSA